MKLFEVAITVLFGLRIIALWVALVSAIQYGLRIRRRP
jgi:hypothetical protein